MFKQFLLLASHFSIEDSKLILTFLLSNFRAWSLWNRLVEWLVDASIVVLL